MIWEKYKGDKRFYVSGRTALDAIIEDIKITKSCKKAYLPSYCCDSMVLPFLRHGMQIEYYDVRVENGFKAEIDPNYECDIILTVDYFGYENTKRILPQAVHIHDVTHSFLRDPAYDKADYYFASLRKWGPIAGAGIACKTNSKFEISISNKKNDRFTSLRNQAYQLKEQYINRGIGEKKEFLNMFAEAEELLDEDYAGYVAEEDVCLKAGVFEGIDKQRRDNARLLTEGLRESNIVELVYPEVKETDVPLFVPVIVKNGLRNDLRKFLIENAVYCPVHWPVHNDKSKEIYDNELSLICDQRYNSADMQREIDLIEQFERENKR